jgi:hypothetical protein
MGLPDKVKSVFPGVRRPFARQLFFLWQTIQQRNESYTCCSGCRFAYKTPAVDDFTFF